MEHGQCHEACEPEQTGHGVEGEYEPFAEEAAIGLVVAAAAACEDGVEDEVGEGEEGEGGDEDEVGGRGRGGGGVGVVQVPGCYCEGGRLLTLGILLVGGKGEDCTVAIQAERDDGEDELDDAKGEAQVKHCGGSCSSTVVPEIVAWDVWSWNVGYVAESCG